MVGDSDLRCESSHPSHFYGLEAGFLEVDEHFDFFRAVTVGIIGLHTGVTKGIKDWFAVFVEAHEYHSVADSAGGAILVKYDVAFLDFVLFGKLLDGLIRIGDFEDVFVLFDVVFGGAG